MFTATISNDLPQTLQKTGPPYIISCDKVCPIGSLTRSVDKTQVYYTVREVSKEVFIRFRGADALDKDCKYFYEVSTD